MRNTSLSSLLVLILFCGCSAEAGGGSGGGGGGGGSDGGPAIDSGGTTGWDGGGPTPGVDAGPPGPDAGCELMEPIATTIVGDPPDMLLVVDISGSMCSPLVDSFPAMTTKLSIMKAALDDLVTAKEARINFGLMLFPSDNTCGAGTVRNGIAPRNASAIGATLDMLNTDTFGCPLAHQGATPTHTSLDAARSYYGTIDVNPIGRYVLLATDGLPNCGAMPEDETVDETVAAISALSAEGIPSYVLGFGSSFDGGGDALSRMATAGGTGSPYSARSAAELDTALDLIAAEIIPPSCTVELDGPARDPALFQVRFDGGPLIPRDESHGSGWDYDPTTNTITFYGADCDRLQSGEVDSVEVDFGCPGPLI